MASSSVSSAATAGLLQRQLKQMQKDKDIPGISCGLVDDNVFDWEVMLMINEDCKYYGGTFLWILQRTRRWTSLFSDRSVLAARTQC